MSAWRRTARRSTRFRCRRSISCCPPAPPFRPGLLDALRRALGDAAMAAAHARGRFAGIDRPGPGHCIAPGARGWRYPSSARCGRSLRRPSGGAPSLAPPPARSPVLSSGPSVGIAGPVRRRWDGEIGFRGGRAVAVRVWAEARHVRGVRTAWRFLAWLAVGLRWRLGQARGARAVPEVPEPAPEPASGPVHADPPLGVEIAALGPRSPGRVPGVRAGRARSERQACRCRAGRHAGGSNGHRYADGSARRGAGAVGSGPRPGGAQPGRLGARSRAPRLRARAARPAAAGRPGAPAGGGG